MLDTVEMITGLLPDELKGIEAITHFAEDLASWNLHELELPSRDNLRPSFVRLMETAQEQRSFGYETAEWAEARRQRFDEFPDKVTPDLQFSDAAVLAMLWAYSISAPRFELSFSHAEDRLPYFLTFGEAQRLARESELDIIEAKHVVEAVFSLWTAVWPFCPK